MSYYLIFDSDGNLKGYTTDKSVIIDFEEQRPNHDFIIKKVDADLFTKEAKKRLRKSQLELSDLYEVQLLPEEYEEVYTTCMNIFAHIYDMLESYMHIVRFIKFNEDEFDIIAKFSLSIVNIHDKLEEGFYQEEKQDEFDECLYVKDIVLNILWGREEERYDLPYL